MLYDCHSLKLRLVRQRSLTLDVLSELEPQPHVVVDQYSIQRQGVYEARLASAVVLVKAARG